MPNRLSSKTLAALSALALAFLAARELMARSTRRHGPFRAETPSDEKQPRSASTVGDQSDGALPIRAIPSRPDEVEASASSAEEPQPGSISSRGGSSTARERRRQRRRSVLILVLSALLFALVFLKTRHDASVAAPPAGDPPALDLVVPQTRATPLDSATRLSVSFGVSGCNNPVTVIVRFGATQPGVAQSWLTRRSLISFGVSSQSVSSFRLFVGSPDAASLSRLGDNSFRGNARLRRVALSGGRGLVIDRTSRGVDYGTLTGPVRGLAAEAPREPSRAGAPPEVIVAFKADWLTRRSFATCYLRLPRVPAPGGNALLPIPGPPRLSETLGYDEVAEAVDDGRFDGRGPAPLAVTLTDSFPTPSDVALPTYSCTGAEAACSGGYLALSEPNAQGKASARLLLLSAILGVLAAIFAEQLVRLK